MSVSCKHHVKEYCRVCTFAGFHIIADETKHWVERLFWVLLVILSWYGSALLIGSAWDAFVNNPISFGVETTYTDWNTKLPSVAVCELDNDDKIFNISDTIWTPDHLIDLEDALRDIAYFRGFAYRLVDVCYATKNPDSQCPTSNYSYYADLVRSPCSQLLQNCSYNGNAFDCCEYFLPLQTDIGMCYTINSIQVENPKIYPMVSNKQHKQGVLSFELLLKHAMLYTLGEDEVPTVTTLTSSTLKLASGKNYQRHLTVRNIENDPLVVQTTREQRACRFNDDNQGGLYPHYSYSTCTVLCRKKRQVEICGCNDHFMIGAEDSKRCNISGISCLHNHASDLTTLKPPWNKRPGLACDCLPSCDETEITVIKDVVRAKGGRSKKKKAYVELILAYLPTERFKRNVVRSRLDLVVSVGGTAGLFVGASLLSFVELIFFFTVRLFDNIYLKKRNRNNIVLLNDGTNAKKKHKLKKLFARNKNPSVIIPLEE
ncbi:unnamed protein product [Colias eurytheme]|nr:unnamed protein product [Colias eurytheme]